MRKTALVITVGLVAAFMAASADPNEARAANILPAARKSQPVTITGAQIPQWSRTPAEGVANPYPSGTQPGERDAHNGTLVVPPDPQGRQGVNVHEVTAFRYVNNRFVEVPVQVDQRFPYFLANGNSDFAKYSGTDEELTYQFNTESWKKVAGRCNARYPSSANDPSALKGYPTKDPVHTLDDDDEISFMAKDAGSQAPASAQAPAGTRSDRAEISLTDPRDGSTTYIYLFLDRNGPAFNASNGYVHYERDRNADQWIDKDSFAPNDPEILGIRNTGYGPNLHGTVCDPNGTVRDSNDRFPRDGVAVRTSSYRWHASGRWMVRGMKVRKASGGGYGPDLIDRFKGRAFRQNADSNVFTVGGFEDEQTNWEANSATLGERRGPVRAIREIWGADSGTNVTKTEYFYRDDVVYRYHLRVHPIPPDGLYTSWDNNHNAVTRYYNQTLDSRGDTSGVAIDGRNDDAGNVDVGVPGTDPKEVHTDIVDVPFSGPTAVYNWEEVSGSHGSLVYEFQLNSPIDAENPAVVPYYRDDSCFDDSTGDDPSRRLFPGSSYDELTGATGAYAGEKHAYAARPCYGDPSWGQQYSLQGPWRQGCFSCMGLHFLFSGDTDNAGTPIPVTEIDGQQYVWAVPTGRAVELGDRYANTVRIPLIPAVSMQRAPA